MSYLFCELAGCWDISKNDQDVFCSGVAEALFKIHHHIARRASQSHAFALFRLIVHITLHRPGTAELPWHNLISYTILT